MTAKELDDALAAQAMKDSLLAKVLDIMRSNPQQERDVMLVGLLEMSRHSCMMEKFALRVLGGSAVPVDIRATLEEIGHEQPSKT